VRAARNGLWLQASWFNQNFDEGVFTDMIHGGALAFPAGQVSEPFVDSTDLAEVAVLALTEDGHAGQNYDLTGPPACLTFGDAVADDRRGHRPRQSNTSPSPARRFGAVLKAEFRHARPGR